MWLAGCSLHHITRDDGTEIKILIANYSKIVVLIIKKYSCGGGFTKLFEATICLFLVDLLKLAS